MSRSSGHYGLANWFECQQLLDEQWRPECTAADIHHSAGAFGWWPNTDRRYNYYSMIAMFMSSTEGRLFQNEIAPIIEAIMRGAAPPRSKPWTADSRARLHAQIAANKVTADRLINASKY